MDKKWSHIYKHLKESSIKNTYCYDFHALQEQYVRLRDALPQFQILFSLKSNPAPDILRFLSMQEGCGADVSSGSELIQAIQCGFSPHHTYFVGPGKSMNELAACIEHDIGGVIVESVSELEVLNSLSQRANKQSRVLLRINPDCEVRGVKMAMAGVSTQFGIDQPEAIEICKSFQQCFPYLTFTGIQAYVGTRILKAEDVAWNIIQVIELAIRLRKMGIPLSTIDVGGGIGVPYYEGEEGLDTTVLAQHLQSYFQENPSATQYKLLLESGRFLVGPSGYFCTQVVDAHQDGDIQHLEVAATPCLHAVSNGSLLTSRQIFAAQSLTATGMHGGPVSTKIWYRVNGFKRPWPASFCLPLMSGGNFVVLPQSGAYGPSTSRVWAHLEGYPCECSYYNHQVRTIHQNENWKSLVEGQRIFSVGL